MIKSNNFVDSGVASAILYNLIFCLFSKLSS